MKQKWKKKWVSALRSKKYEQGAGELRNRRDEFCCLGVLCDIVQPTCWTKKRTVKRHRGFTLLPPWIAKTTGLDDTDVQQKLAYMNDAGQTFAQIARHIERAL